LKQNRLINKILLPCFLAFLFFGFTPKHKFYVSHLAIDENRQSKNLELTAKIFNDDLHTAIELQEGKKIQSFDVSLSKTQETFIFNYLKSKLQIDINNKTIEPKWIGCESELDVIWIYLEYPFTDKGVKELKITCHLLTEVFESQQNILDIKLKDKKATFLLNQKSATAKLNVP
jgi:hypothetical protein